MSKSKKSKTLRELIKLVKKMTKLSLEEMILALNWIIGRIADPKDPRRQPLAEQFLQARNSELRNLLADVALLEIFAMGLCKGAASTAYSEMFNFFNLLHIETSQDFLLW